MRANTEISGEAPSLVPASSCNSSLSRSLRAENPQPTTHGALDLGELMWLELTDGPQEPGERDGDKALGVEPRPV